MEDIPQPSQSPYSAGDRVQVYLSSGDPDHKYHGAVCEVVDVLRDDLGEETGRTTDAYSYLLRDVESAKELLITFHHHDLVPAEDVE